MIFIKYVIRYIKPYLGRMSVGLIIKFIGTIMDLLIPMILAHIIDVVVPQGEIKKVVFWGVLMVLCSVVCLWGNVTANRMAARVARDTTQRLRLDLFTKIFTLSGHQIDSFTVASLESRLTSDTYHVNHMVGMMQRLGVRAPILLIGGIAVTFTMEPILTLVLISVLPIMTWAVFRISRKGIPLYSTLQTSVDDLTRVVRENIQGVRVIKALSKEDYEKRRFDEANHTVVAKEKHAGITMAASSPLMNLFLNLGLVIVILVGAVRVNSGLTQPGVIIAFMTYFTLILNAMLSITRIFVMLSRGTASASRIGEVLDTESDLAVLPPEDGAHSEHTENVPHIEFQEVSFRYADHATNALTDIDFTLKHGEVLGIIGATGSGKSTLISLLMRFYDRSTGNIFIDGTDVRCIPLDELRKKFGVVLQNDFIYADTIRENIDFGREIPQENIEKAAALAQAEEFIAGKEEGYDHILAIRGADLSGGQKQRLLISRAFAGDPEILILDDSSSALDYATDAKLRRAIREKLDGGSTAILVAQRVSSVMFADRILVLDHGRIIGCGTHDELIESCDVYREISESQIGGAIVE